MDLASKSTSISIFRKNQKLFRPLYIVCLLIILIFGTSYGFLFKFQIYNSADKYFNSLGYPSKMRDNGILKESLKLLSYYKLNLPFADKFNIDTFDVEIKFKNLYKIYNKKNEALKIGSLINSDNDYVSAKINHLGRKIPVKMRLKGDMLDHLEGRKWSYRVKTKGSDHFQGLRVFSIQHPMTRGYQWEPLFYTFLRSLSIITPRYFFNNMTLNGEDIGIMAIEEHFSKEVLESQNRRESVILRFDESESRSGLLDGSAHSHMAQNAYIKPFRSSKILKKENLKNIYLNSLGRIQEYLKGNLDSSKVFNLDAMATYIAACEIWDAEHGMWWTNMRFYVNPITMLLEPIAFDNESLHFNQGTNLLYHSANSIFPVSTLMQDLDFRKRVSLKLKEISKVIKEKDLWSKIKTEEKKLRSILSVEFPFIFKVPIQKYQQRLERLLMVKPEDMLYEKR
tara:strand:- start:110557 stop:111915 length:1359 start_codon:yes stop_codon:yes gene_type:complete